MNRYAVLTETLPFHVGGAITEESQEQERQSEVVLEVEGTVFQYNEYGPYACVVYGEKHPGMLSVEDLASPA